MDAARFDAWTRRRFGLTAGSLTLSLLSTSRRDAAAKKKCRKLGKTCRKHGKPCCGSLACDLRASDMSGQKRCCKTNNKSCNQDTDCCTGLLCCGSPTVCSETCISDRALKTNLAPVDPADLLQRVRDLPITIWHDLANPADRHIGPAAPAFATLFGVGDDDRSIHPLDSQGVALAAIQGLAAELERVRHVSQTLTARLDALAPATERPERRPRTAA
jgi:hypothetical protein